MENAQRPPREKKDKASSPESPIKTPRGWAAMPSTGAKAAIGGLACRLPNSKNAQEFWENLVDGIDMIGPTRWPQGLYDLPPRMGAVLDENKFDNEFFNIPDKAANRLNPMLRHLLEVVHECIVDSCLPLTALQQTTTGLYLATFGSDYDCIETSRLNNNEFVSMSPYLATEIVRSLNIHGPSVTVDTACSSSMSALNMAVNAIQSGRCSYAIVASCNMILNPMFSQQMFLLNMLCKEGRSRVFDKDAAGYVRGEGFAALLIAREPDMFERVYANIKGIGINCDGYKPQGITFPNSETQAKLLRRVYERSCIDVGEVEYVEAHGTGTQAGDSQETGGIQQVFCKGRSEPLLIGSVKSNIGHTEATAGLAAIIKCLLCMQHGEIPGNLNYKEANPKITGITSGQLKVVDKNTPYNGGYIGVNSFGFGGVNGHVILEPYRNPSYKNTFEQVQRHLLVPLTVRNQDGVQAMIDFVSNNRYNTSLLSLVTKSLLSCDNRQPIRGYIQMGPKEEDIRVCSESWEEDEPNMYLCLGDLLSGRVGVSPDLLENDTFLAGLKDCATSIKRVHPSLDIVSVLMKESLMPCSRTGLLAASALLITMFDCLDQAGIQFEGMVGCGLTEIIGAYLDGCLGLDQCFSIMDCIGKELEKFPEKQSTSWLLYDVTLDMDHAYSLGPWVQVLTVHDADHVTIAVDTDHKEIVLKKIHSEGGIFDPIPCTIPLYSSFMADSSTTIYHQLHDIIPAPKYWSSHNHSSNRGWFPVPVDSKPKLCDARYLSQLLTAPVNIYSALKQLPEDRILIKMMPTAASRAQQAKMAERRSIRYHFHDQSTNDYSTVAEAGSKSGRGLNMSTCFNQSGLDDSYTEGSYSCIKSAEDIQCCMSTESLCYTLGEVHIAGHQPCVDFLYPSDGPCPLGLDMPRLSHLVTWDHSANWDMPHWLEFSCRDRNEDHHVHFYDDDKTSNPIARIIYGAWEAISYDMLYKIDTKLEPFDVDVNLIPTKMYDIVMPQESMLTSENIDGAIVQVLVGLQKFAVVKGETLLMHGKFKVDKSFPLPSLPGYNLDINQNVQTSPIERESQCEKTDMKWEDSWEDFINDVIEFATLYMEPSLREFTMDCDQHLEEAKTCSAFLGVLDKTTGICRAGGCVLQFDPPLNSTGLDSALTQVSIDKADKIALSRLMVYGLSGSQVATDRVIVCQAEKVEEADSTSLLGLINLNGGKIFSEVPLPAKWQPEDLETVVPYLLAAHILYDVAQVQEHHKLLVLPPIDSVGIYIIHLACKLGCSVFTSTYDVESLQTLESMFPYIRVTHGEELYDDLMSVTEGEGVDVCIRVSGGEINPALKYITKNGHLIQGIPPPQGSSMDIVMSGRGNKISIVTPLRAVSNFMNKSTEDAETLMFDMKDEAVTQLIPEGFPESKGILYSQDNASSFLQPIQLDKLILLITEPNLGGNSEDLMEMDLLCVEKIQALIAPKPKDFSIMDTSCLLKTGGAVEEKEESTNYTLDRGMIHSPDRKTQSQDISIEVLSPDVNIISFTEDANRSRLSPGKGNIQVTSTPMMNLLCSLSQEKSLEESYIDSVKSKTPLLPKSDDANKFGMESENLKPSDTPDGARVKIIEENVAPKFVKDKKPLAKQLLSEKKVRNTPKKVKPAAPVIVLTDIDNQSKIVNSENIQNAHVDTPAMKDGTFRQLMQHKAKLVPPRLEIPKPKVDLLMICSPITPMNNALKEIITPKMDSNLVYLNPEIPKSSATPLYIIHPVTGMLNLLEGLGGLLKVPCFGVKRTGATPSDTLTNVARNSIQLTQPEGPYRICGYSFGSLVALEIALQLQAEGNKVEKLILLDGSPMYVQSQIACGLKHLPANATKAQIEESLEVGSLINWMKMYGFSQNIGITFGLLRKMPSLEEKISMAVDLTFGDAIVSTRSSKTRWITARERVLKNVVSTEKQGSQFADTAKELMRHMRKEKATVFVNHIVLASTYQPNGKFQGDIHLHRVKCAPVFENVDLPVDYGLQKLCTGKVHTKLYDGDHESFLKKEALPPLVKDLHEVLKVNKK